MNFCDWCGEPAVAGKELCRNCLVAQASVDQNKVSVPKEEEPKWTQPTAGQKALYGVQVVTIILLKAVGFTVMGLIMFVSALAGTCALLIASGSLLNPIAATGPLLAAFLAFALTYLMYKLVNEMNKIEAKPIGPKKLISDYNFDQEMEKHMEAAPEKQQTGESSKTGEDKKADDPPAEEKNA